MMKLNWFDCRVLIVIMACSLTGCSLLLPSTMRKSWVGTTPETRRTDLKREVKLTFAPTPKGDGLNFRLQYQPYYQEKRRSIKRYKWELRDDGLFGDNMANNIFVIGLVELVFASMALYPDEVSQDDPEFREFLEKYQQPILIGVGSDFLVSSLLLLYYSGTKTESTDWKTSPVKQDPPIKILNHPLSISFPQFGYKDTYRTDDNGSVTIPTNDLIDRINEVSKISDLIPALRAKSIKIDASAKLGKERVEESFAIYEHEQFSSPLFQALKKKTKRLRAP